MSQPPQSPVPVNRFVAGGFFYGSDGVPINLADILKSELAEHNANIENNLLGMLISHFSEDEETWSSKELQSELMEIQRLRNMK